MKSVRSGAFPLSAGAVGVWLTAFLLLVPLPQTSASTSPGSASYLPGEDFALPRAPPAEGNATENLTQALNRLVLLASLGAGAIVSLAWARVAVSWFSHDPMKKVTAKERARDAAIGSLVLLAAVSGLAWALAHWVLTGT